MKVDISPNLPPISSCTAAAPSGSGSDGGGSSVPHRSRRRIIATSLCRVLHNVYPRGSRTNGCHRQSHTRPGILFASWDSAGFARTPASAKIRALEIWLPAQWLGLPLYFVHLCGLRSRSEPSRRAALDIEVWQAGIEPSRKLPGERAEQLEHSR